MPKIIKLKGTGGTGKTTTLKLLADKLKTLGAKEKARYQTNKNGDIAVVTEYNNKTIGIVTAGDVKVSLTYGYGLLGPNCDVYIFSCRTKGVTTDWIDKTFSNCEIIEYGKWYVNTNTNVNLINNIRNSANESQVDSIITLL